MEEEEEEGMHHKCSSGSMKQYKVNDQKSTNEEREDMKLLMQTTSHYTRCL
jgi:hypothetical protein